MAGLAPWVVALIPAAFLAGRVLDVAALGDEAVSLLGLPPRRMRILTLPIAAACAAAAVATVGAVAFVGLIAPHGSRLLVGTRHHALIAVAALVGAIMLTCADIIGRLLIAPKELPAGLVVAVIGAPLFALLLRGRSLKRSA